MIGLGLTAYQKLHLKIEFIPVFVFSLVITAMFFAGLWNFMPLMIYSILVGGNVLLCMALFRRNKSSELLIKRQDVFLPGILIVGGLAVFFLIQLPKARIMHFDSYSHWITVIKDILMYDQLTSASPGIVHFLSYPPGSALFIYFASHILGGFDGSFLVIQMLLILSCLLCLFGFCDIGNDKDDVKARNIKRAAVAVFMAVGALYLLNGASSIYELLVDMLLMMFGMAGIAVIEYYRDDVWKAAIMSGPIMCATMLIKNSGIIFVLIPASYLMFIFYMHRKRLVNTKNKEWKLERLAPPYRKLKTVVCTAALAPFVCLFLWHMHVNYITPGDGYTNHQMTAQHYQNVLNNKTQDHVRQYTENYLERSFDLENNETTRGIIIWNSGIITIYLILRLLKQKERKLITSLVVADALMLLYLAGVYLMYLLSMLPGGEDLGLVAYDRYTLTGFRCFEGYLLIQLALLIHRGGKLGQVYLRAVCSFACIAAFCAMTLDGLKNVFVIPAFEGSIVQKIETASKIANSRASSVVYFPFDTGMYAARYSEFLMWAPEPETMVVVELDDTEEFLEILSEHDYLIIAEEDGAIREFMMSRAIMKENYIGTYYASSLLKRISTSQ